MYNKASIYKGGGVYNLGDGASSKLPANTLRFEFSKMDYDPAVAGVGSIGTWKKVSAKFHNVWDWKRTGSSWYEAFKNAFTSEDNKVSVIAAGDTSSVTSLVTTFSGCSSLVSICLFNTENVTNMQNFLSSCTSIEKLPLFNTKKVTNVIAAFSGCFKVKDGALALYTQMSTQTTPPENITNCFKDCGKNTETGAAELAQIPASWGGTAPASLNMGAPQNLTEPLSPSVIDGDDSLTK